MKTEQELKEQIKRWISVFTIFLILSGITAFPLEWELSILVELTKNAPIYLKDWIDIIYQALQETNSKYPFIAYGTDWLAFAHLLIAVLFFGALKDPVRNIWVIEFGMIACISIFPLAFICGPIRHIPFYWQLIDCSFGVFGFVPLYIAYRKTLQLEKLTQHKS